LRDETFELVRPESAAWFAGDLVFVRRGVQADVIAWMIAGNKYNL
jgi:hypothetical protein